VLTVTDKERAAKDAKEWAGHQEKWAEDFKEEKKEAQGLEEECEVGREQGQVFRSRRNTAGDWPGRKFCHAAYPQPHLLVPGDSRFSRLEWLLWFGDC
jgi:hypothetical protein